MKRLALICVLAFGTAIGGATASSAAPATTGVAGIGSTDSGIQLVRDKRHYRGHRYYRHHHRGYRHGRHWRRDRYRGWHRYHRRPWNWRSRGCVILGPVWVCP